MRQYSMKEKEEECVLSTSMLCVHEEKLKVMQKRTSSSFWIELSTDLSLQQNQKLREIVLAWE